MNEGSRLENIIDSVMYLVEGERVLDVGTGFGTVVSKLLKSTSASIVSIDPEAWTFDRIEEEFSDELESGRLSLMKSRAESIPFKDKTFSTSLAICSLHHLSSPQEGLREMERVTSGRVIVTDWDPSSSGAGHPHSPEELGRSKDAVLDYARKNGYETKEMGKWFMVWK